MPKRKTTEQFITESKEIHGDKYDYSLVEYTNSQTKVKIICPIHGTFNQPPKGHIKGQGCYDCGIIKRSKSKRKSNRQFIKESKEVHGDKYNYSLVEYVVSKIKVKIICTEHGIFEQRPSKHLMGDGCPKCYGNIKKTKEQYIKDSVKVHGKKYDYSLVEYVNNYTKVKIICPEHGIFNQPPKDHLSGHGCKKCADIDRTINMKSSTDEFIEKSKKVHGDLYDYSPTSYNDCVSIVKIVCKKHGIFEQRPNYHLSGNGCQKCHESKGEKEIRHFLEKNNIKFKYQKTFNGCVDKRKLPFDFYLPEQNMCVEFDGIQHYEPIGFFGGEESLHTNQKRDKIKNIYCKENNINLIRISYKENITERMVEILKTLK